MFSKSFVCLAALLLAGSAAFAGEATGTLVGKDSSDLRVLIRSIDNGDILWVGTYQLDTKAKVVAGAHTVSVMCEFNFGFGKELLPGEVSITVEPGKKYNLDGAKAENGNRCTITVKAK
jgi:hypothetical protein